MATRAGETRIGEGGSVTLSEGSATLAGQDANGVDVTFLLRRVEDTLTGEARAGDGPPEPILLKRSK